LSRTNGSYAGALTGRAPVVGLDSATGVPPYGVLRGASLVPANGAPKHRISSKFSGRVTANL